MHDGQVATVEVTDQQVAELAIRTAQRVEALEEKLAAIARVVSDPDLAIRTATGAVK